MKIDSAILFVLAASLLDAIAGGALTGYLQNCGRWTPRKQRIISAYQAALFVLLGVAAINLLTLRALFLSVILWLAYVEDVLYYWWLPAVRILHLAATGATQRVFPQDDFFPSSEKREPTLVEADKA